MRFLNYLLTAFSLFLVNMSVAQSPDWTVDPNDYANAMTIVGFLKIDKVESDNTSDMIAAFIGGEVRGVSNPVYEAKIDRYVIYLRVFSNASTGEITFKAYDEASDTTYDLLQNVDFEVNGYIGGLTESFVWSNVQLNSGASISSFEIPNQAGVSNIDGDTIRIVVNASSSDELKSQIATFEVSQGAEVKVEGLVQQSGQTANDFDQLVTYKVQSEDLSTINDYVVKVSTDNSGPTSIALSNQEIQENLSSSAFIGTFNVTDPDPSDAHELSLVSGDGDANNSDFAIINGTLISQSSFNFENVNELFIRIKATDEKGLSVEQGFVINVTDENDTPDNVALSITEIEENQPVKTLIGILVTTDEDPSDTHTYELVAGEGDDDNSKVTLEGANIESAEIFDFESQPTLKLRVESTDDLGATVQKALTVSVTDVNDVPYAINLSSDGIDENQTSGQVIGEFSTVDEDSGDTFTYSFATGEGEDDNDLFEISGTALQSGASFDHEINETLSIRIKSTDAAGGMIETSFTVNVNDVNEAPTLISLSAGSIDENGPVGTFIGDFSTEDPDEGDTYDFILKSNAADNNSFVINDGNKLVSLEVFDFEIKSNYEIRIEAIDNSGIRYEKSFDISVTNVLEPGILIDKEKIQFEITDVGETSSQSFVVSNNGSDGTLSITSFDLPMGFTVSPIEASLAPEEDLTFTLLFEPSNAGVIEEMMVINSNVENKEVLIEAEAAVVTGLEDLPDLSDRVSIYPMPAKDYFVLETELFNSRPFDIELFDPVSGTQRRLDVEMQFDRIRVNTQSLFPGLYLLVLRNEDFLIKKKILIIK
ncbi:cadherin domain-containing protein [Roseivirga sp.]|uniref:cadherin domain-containing protein n=1 Tax=Roseivirga sp. TaxID=1964215 RepID=UPI003B8DA996